MLKAQKIGERVSGRFSIKTKGRPTLADLSKGGIKTAYVEISTSFRPDLPFVREAKKLSHDYITKTLPEEIQPHTIGHCLYVQFKGVYNLKPFNDALKKLTERVSLKPRYVEWTDEKSGNKFVMKTATIKAPNLVLLSVNGRSVFNSFTTRAEIEKLINDSPTLKSLDVITCSLRENTMLEYECF